MLVRLIDRKIIEEINKIRTKKTKPSDERPLWILFAPATLSLCCALLTEVVARVMELLFIILSGLHRRLLLSRSVVIHADITIRG